MNPQPHPETRLRACAALAQALADDWRTFENTCAALATPTTASTGGDSGSGRSSNVPDPTFAVIASHERYHETAAEVTEALGHLRAAQRTITRVIRNDSAVAATLDSAARNARCSGEIDPTCTKNAVRDGLCWGCYQRRRTHGTEGARARS